MATELKVLFYLKKNQLKRNGLSPLMGRITIGKTMCQFSLKLDADAALWDSKAGKMTGKSRFALDVNRQIDRTNVLIHTRYREIESNQNRVTALELKNAIQGIASTQDTLLSCLDEHNKSFFERVGTDRCTSTYNKYLYVYKRLQSFLRHKYNLTDISFKALNYSFIEQFVFYLQVENELKTNTISDTLVTLRRIVKKAINKGVINKDPFLGYELERDKTKHKNLTKEELDKILSVELSKPAHQISRDMFVLACFTGLAYVDIKNLTPEKIVTMENGSKWIQAQRKKTGTPFNVRLMDIPLTIIERYKDSQASGQLLPVPSKGVIDNALRYIHRKCELKQGLSFHMGRHTFASLITLSEGVPIETVSRMLGHKNIKTTQIYAEVSHDKILQDMKILSGRIAGKYTWVD
ncbi:Tyrosine recombinase XerC [termite gut metagenome]|uniref:Tyrosine recombinase XerC n=2 Tax=termite gut metagenome TaxID=433724 RepID=A0A5J4RXY7_9ZZZZ